MTRNFVSGAFNTSAALTVIDGLLSRDDEPFLPSVSAAWEAAWIACLTNSPRWAVTAEQEFGDVLTELHGVVWNVQRDVGGRHRDGNR